MSLEIERAKPGETDGFWERHDRDWRSELWNFRVVWLEQRHDVVARDGETLVLDGAIAVDLAQFDQESRRALSPMMRICTSIAAMRSAS